MKKLVVLAAVFAALGAFVYFYEIRGQEERERQEKLAESLFQIEDDQQIESLTIERPDAETVTLNREGEGWRLESPVQAPADATSVDSLLSRITEAGRERTLEDPGELDEYGLAEAATRLRVRTADSEKILLLGNKSFNSGQMYARFEDGSDVVLTSTVLVGALTRDVDDWRDKRLLRFERSEVEALEITLDGRTLAFEKRDDQWFLTSPIEEKADQSAVASLLTTLDSAQVSEFTAEGAVDPAEFGLDAPQLRVRLRTSGDDDRWTTLEVSPDNDGVRYARDPAGTQVVSVAETLVTGLDKELLELRDRDVVEVSQNSIARLRLQREESSLVLRQEDFKWLIEEPVEQKDEEALAYKIWYPIDDLEFESIDDGGVGDFSQPDITLTLELEDGSTARYLFVEDNGAYRARRESDGRQGRLSRESYEKLQVKVEDIV